MTSNRAGTRDGPARVIASLLGAENDARLAQVVRRHFDIDLVARENADVVLAHFPGNMTEHNVTILELDPESCTRKIFQYFALHCDDVVFCHLYPLIDALNYCDRRTLLTRNDPFMR